MNARNYKRYLLFVLMVVWACNAMDNVALGLVMQNIKVDLHLSDTQLGVMTGIAFSLFYAIMGIPLARWADRGNRITILSLTAALWSVLVSCCGIAANCWQLMLLRIGVGVGESGCAPTTQSLLADYFTRAERPRATGIFLLGDALSMFIGFFLAGWIAQFYGWRIMFMLMGLPGLVAAGLVWLTLSDPRLSSSRRMNFDSRAFSGGEPVEGLEDRGRERRPGLVMTLRALWHIKTYRYLLLYSSVSSFFLSGSLQWQPAFLARSYGLMTGELGTWLAALSCSAVLVGRYFGGAMATRFAANNERLQLRAMAIAFSVSGILSTCIYLAPSLYLAFGFMGLSLVAMNATMPSQYAMLQTLIPEHMRALAVAISFFCAALIGNGLGPLSAGALSDALHAKLGEESLRYALLALSPGYVWGAWYLWRAGQTVRCDMRRLQQPPGGSTEGAGALLSPSPASIGWTLGP